MNKRGIAIDKLTHWLIGIAVLVIILVFAYLLKDKLIEMGEYLKGVLT
jgi:hypothetical protein